MIFFIIHIMPLISTTVAFISGSNAKYRRCRFFYAGYIPDILQLDIPVSRMHMPMEFCAIGGCLALVGSSPLILLNDLMEKWYIGNAQNPGLLEKDLEPFGLLTVTLMGITLVTIGRLYFVFFGKFVLPKREGFSDTSFINADLTVTYGKHIGRIFELEVPETFQAQNDPVSVTNLKVITFC